MLYKEEQELTLEQCLDNLNNKNLLTSLPRRENEISIIENFISYAFLTDPEIVQKKGKTKKQKESNQPEILFLSGNPGTGKTASVLLCKNNSILPSKIEYINCKVTPLVLYKETDILPRILIVDEVESYHDFAEIASNVRHLKYQLICISNAHEDDKIIKKAGGLKIINLKYNSYNEEDLKVILTEKMGGPSLCIEGPALDHLVKSIIKERGDARAAIKKLSTILTAAISQNIEKINLINMIKLIEKPTTIDFELPIFHQVALISIFLDGKNWAKKYQNICAEKQLYNFPPPKDLYSALLDYQGLIKGSFKNPITTITREALLDSIDDSLKYLL